MGAACFYKIPAGCPLACPRLWALPDWEGVVDTRGQSIDFIGYKRALSPQTELYPELHLDQSCLAP